MADAVACAGSGPPTANASTTNPCALLTAAPSCGAGGGSRCRSDLVISWGYSGYNHQAVSEALQRLEDQRSMFDPAFYRRLTNGADGFESWFDSWVGRSLNPAAAHAALLQPGAVDAAVAASARWNAQHRPLRLQSPDADFDVALGHCSGEMMYQYEHPGFLHGTHDAKYGKISIGTCAHHAFFNCLRAPAAWLTARSIRRSDGGGVPQAGGVDAPVRRRDPGRSNVVIHLYATVLQSTSNSPLIGI